MTEPIPYKVLPVETGARWAEILRTGDVPAGIVNRIKAHLSSIGSDDLVYTNLFGFAKSEMDDDDPDIFDKLVLVGADGAGRQLRRRSFGDDPDKLIDNVGAIYLCRAVSAGKPDIPYVLIDTLPSDSDEKAKLMCRRVDFTALHALLRMGGRGGALWRGSYTENSDDIKALREEDYEFQDNLLSDVLDQTVNFLTGEKAEKLRAWGLPPKRGVILYGQPGNGKTVLTRLCAKRALELGVNVVIIEGKRRSTFDYDRISFGDQLRQGAARGPALLLFEDLDLHCPPRPVEPSDTKDVDNSPLAELLEFLDGVVPTKGYALLATTNYIERIDPALARSGRLEGRFKASGPTLPTRIKLLNRYLEIGPEPRPEVSAVAKLLDGCSFADLAEISRRFKISAVFNEGADLNKLFDQTARDFTIERKLNTLHASED